MTTAERERLLRDRDQLGADLIQLKELLADPSRWTQKELAKNGIGERVHPLQLEATCFCLLGGMLRVCGGTNRRYNQLWLHLHDQLPRHCLNLPEFNDHYSHKSVMGLISLALTATTSSGDPL